MGILNVENLSLSKNHNFILDGVNIDVRQGRIHAIVGPNGAGKSSLAFSIMGLEGYRDVEGELKFKGERINELNAEERANRGITLAWQEPARYEGLTVRKFIGAASR